MALVSENRMCQSCKASFEIDAEDFQFYEKMKVPPPTWCPECRLIRRLAFRNDRSLFKRSCDLCKKSIIAMYSPGSPFPVYCHDCWLSDKWNPLDYGRDYDFSRSFFEQFKELQEKVPRLNLFQRNSQNSFYSNMAAESKNVYLGYSIVSSEDVLYSKSVDYSSGIMDSLAVINSEQCYENAYAEKNYNTHFIEHASQCIDSWFLYACVNCRNCALSSNLINKEFVFQNEQCTKEEYFEKVKSLNLETSSGISRAREEFERMKEKAMRRYATIMQAADATGDNVLHAKNAHVCFDSYEIENVKYGYRILKIKDSMDVCHTGLNSELIYEYVTGGRNSSLVRFSTGSFDALSDVHYTDYCSSSEYLFGCIGLEKQSYCILNKKYSEEEYETLTAKIIEQMGAIPYADGKGRAYRYGEFFPIEHSLFAYNETVAQEYFPITKEKAEEKGYRWYEREERSYGITLRPESVPESIDAVNSDILDQVIGCSHAGNCNEECTVAFKIVPQELQFYRKFRLPIPRFCPNCRHFMRLKKQRPLHLWERQCLCLAPEIEGRYKNTNSHVHGDARCPNTFETPYRPGETEIVYCAQCYQTEIR